MPNYTINILNFILYLFYIPTQEDSISYNFRYIFHLFSYFYYYLLLYLLNYIKLLLIKLY